MGTGELPPALAGALLVALRRRARRPRRSAASRVGMRELARRRAIAPGPYVDIVGTGGDGSHSLNLSTGSALLAAACGVPVVKHGNRSVSSRCGSADVLGALGLPIPLDERAAGECLARVGFTFLFAPHYHPAMKHIAPVRQALGVRTVFNVLGPLVNPAAPPLPRDRRVQRLGRGADGRDARRNGASTRVLVIHGALGLGRGDARGPVRLLRRAARVDRARASRLARLRARPSARSRTCAAATPRRTPSRLRAALEGGDTAGASRRAVLGRGARARGHGPRARRARGRARAREAHRERRGTRPRGDARRVRRGTRSEHAAHCSDVPRTHGRCEPRARRARARRRERREARAPCAARRPRAAASKLDRFDVIAELKLRSPAAGGLTDGTFDRARSSPRTRAAARPRCRCSRSRPSSRASSRISTTPPRCSKPRRRDSRDAQGLRDRSVPGARGARGGRGRHSRDRHDARRRDGARARRQRARVRPIRAARGVRPRGSRATRAVSTGRSPRATRRQLSRA